MKFNYWSYFDRVIAQTQTLAGGPLGSIGRSQATSVKALQEQIREEERKHNQSPVLSSPVSSSSPPPSNHFNGANQYV